MKPFDAGKIETEGRPQEPAAEAVEDRVFHPAGRSR
jgi:hypothetical protein